MTQKQRIIPLIGWRESLALPTLGIDKINAKIDTGARTSALHAFQIKIYREFDRAAPLLSDRAVPLLCDRAAPLHERDMVKFRVHPIQRDTHTTIECIAPLIEYRHVTNSGGHTQLRPVIESMVKLGDYQWTIELTLTNRDAMGFRMLLGRQAVKNRFLVDCQKSFIYLPKKL
ncbi:ATP-dependent zinc protease family protein [Geminocystis herdmanii]|uniref:ATP-dependent zinc protease family protein n=1 Tax=Geminocystis herdmanii TaxID=669359 RepID=UPI00035CA6F6|nr:RimK/LysX family protein [Geminocystis herdmanii]